MLVAQKVAHAIVDNIDFVYLSSNSKKKVTKETA
jgi:hypothetical protein